MIKIFDYGEKLNIKIYGEENNFKIIIDGAEIGKEITATDFGKDLLRRKMEGVSPNPNEEIEVISGIENEKIVNSKIEISYENGEYLSAIILAGTIAKKILDNKIVARARDIGGISTDEKNKEYLSIAIQKMLATNDSIGGTVEAFLPEAFELNRIKKDFSYFIFDLFEEVEAIQFGHGINENRQNLNEYKKPLNTVLITFGPHRKEKKIPCLAGVRDIVIENLLSIIVINKLGK